MISSSNSGLVVPIDLVAYCVGSIDAHERTGTFAGATTSYVAQASQDTAQAFLGANVTRDPNLQPPLWPLEAGIHLHWAAPDGLTHASQTQDGLEFPALPNRWLVTRVVVQGSSVTGKSWIIESDTLSTTPPGGKRAPTLPVQDDAQNYRYLGVWKVFDGSWREPTIPQDQTIKALFGSEIHAVASGDIAFAAFYPNARGIFGFYDDTSDLQPSGSEPLNLMYLVTGWFSDPASDPLSTHSDPADLQQSYKWTYTPGGATPRYSLYSGVAQDIRWNPATRYLGDDRPAVQVDVAIGNNPAEALAAYFRGIDHPSLPLFEQLFTALEMGLLSRLGQPAPGQLAELAETIHEKGFGSVDGGTIYTIVPADPAAAAGGSDAPAPNLPLPLADALNLLNEYQQQRDLATAEVQQYRWQLFADWYRLVQVNATDTTAANATLSSRLALWPTIQRNLATAQGMVEEQRAVVTPMLGSAWALKPVPAPRFWVPNEPVVLMAGPDVAAARRHGGDGRYEANGNLVCRLTTDLVSAATVSVTSPVTISGSRFSAALPPSPNHLPHAADVAALVMEACVLNTSVAAALTGGSDAALMTALLECLTAGAAPGGNVYQSFAGALPSPVEMNWWGPKNPWLPLMMLWELDFAPLFPTASRGAAQSYAPGFFTANFTVDPDDVGTIAYTPSGGAGSIDVDPQTLDFDPRAGRAARYTGSAVLSAAAADNLEAFLEQYLQTTSDATLQTILGQLQQTNILMQAMSGLNAALLTREQSLQLHIGVGGGAPFSLRNVTKEVQAVLPDLSLIPPLSPVGNGSFNPVRAGFARIGLQILDTFGEKRPVQIGNLYLAKDLSTSYRGNVEPGIVYLQPRLVQGARLLFRWLSADTLEYDEMNAHPATSPVCGWLLPNHLQRGLFFYDQLGRPIGSLTVMEDATGITWQSAPGNDATIDEGVDAAMQDENPHLRDLVVMLSRASVGFFRAFYDAVDVAASSVSPPSADSAAGMAVLVGRPVALVQASLLLELQGITAYDQTWNTLVPGEKYQDTDDGLSAVQLPAVVGDIDQLDDGLVGYFKQGPGGSYDLGTFYTEAADASATSGVVRPAATNLLLTPTSTPEGELPAITTGEQKLLMLMDPRAGIHLTTGILPTQYIEIPPAQYADTLDALEMTFLTAPVLRPLSGLALPLPRESGYTWSWVEENPNGNGGSEWIVTPNIVPPTASALWQYSPQQLTEGWLRLNPEVLAFTLQNASGGASVKGGAANTLTLTITNRRQADVTFNPGKLANEGTPPVGSVFYMHFGAMIDPSQVESVQPSAAGWTFQALHDAQYGDYWAATPAAGSPVTLGPGQALTITLADVVAVNTASQAQIYFDYYDVQGVNDGVDIAIVAIQTGTPRTASPNDFDEEQTMHSKPTPPGPRSSESLGRGSPKHEAATFASKFPQLGFQFVNYGSSKTGVDNVVYIAANTTANRIDLQIMLNTGSSILVAGDVVPPEQLPPVGQQTLLYLDLSPLQLTSDAWKLLRPAADGWSCVVYADEQVIGMAPSKSGTTLVAGAPIAIHLEGLELDRAPPSQTPQLAVTYYNVPGVTSGNTSWTSSFSVAVQNPPGGKADLTRVLAVSLVSNLVVNSSDAAREVKNKLTLQFSQTSENIGVLAGPDTLFTVSFVYGKAGDTFGYGALTDVPSAQDIVVARGDNAGQWVSTANTGAESPNWTLQPPKGKPIAGSGAEAVVSWDFTSIVTSYQPGPTVMLVQYQNVPGYEDGVYTLVIDKIPHVVIRSLSVSPSPTYLREHRAKVTVKWEVDYATSLELIQNYEHIDVTGETSYPATLAAQTTAFSLKAAGPGADVDNVDWANAQAIALPVINSFVGAPTEIYAGSRAHDVQLNWAVDTTGKVEISSTSGEVSGGGGAVDHTSATVDKPQMITLTPVTDPGVAAPARNLVISAFEPTVKSYPAPAATSCAAASPSAPFLALVDSAGNRVIAVDTVQFSTITTIPVGRSPSAVIFSQDGSLMVTLNGDATVSLHRIVISGGVPSFAALGAVSLPGRPRAAVITPAADRIYLTLDGKPGRLAALTKGAKGYALGQHVAVGNAPRGLAVDPSGARLYVADSADDSISIIGIGIDGSLKVTAHAQGVCGQPTGLAVTPDGSTLLAACPQRGVVWAIDAQNPSTGQRRQLTVGSSPVAIAVTPSGAYAFVANAGDGTVSLLDVWNGPLSCAVLQKSIQVGTKPSGVAVSPDGLVVLVSDAGSQKFGVISLQTYELATVATQVGRQPTDVAVSPDGKAALIWNNALLGASQPVPGARYYPVASGVATQILSSVPMVECVFAPPPTDGSTSITAYAIGSMEPTLYVLDLSDPMNPQETEVLLPIVGRTLGLALSSDGQTLFVVLVDRSHQYTLLIGSTAGGSWTAAQSLPLYKGGQFPGAVRMAVTPDGAKLFIADLKSHAFNVAVRGAGGQYALSAPTIAIPGVVNVSVLPDGSKAYVLGAGPPNTITVIDVATLQAEPVSVMQSYVNLQELVPSPDGRRLYAPDESAGALRVVDPSSLRILQTLPLAEDISQATGAAGAAISPDASRIFVANSGSGTMSVLRQIPMGGGAAADPTRAELMRAATYTGTFIRQVLGQTPTTPSNGSCSCPDIIFHGQTDAGDPRQFAKPDSYAQMSPADVDLNQPNFVYLRGFLANTRSGSNLFFYHVPSSLMLWPQNWSGDNVQIGSSMQPQNWAWAPPVDGSSVVVTAEALVWTPQEIDPNVEHYCTIVWADNSTQDAPVPPDFSTIGHLQSCDELLYFLAKHPNMGWRNTTDHTTPPPDARYTTYLSTQGNPETFNVTIFFSNITDGTFMVNVTGDVTFSSGPTPLAVSSYLGGYPINGLDGLQFGPNQTALLIVTYQTGQTPLSKFASIHARVQHPITAMMIEKLAVIAAQPGVVLPISYMTVRRGGKLATSPVFLLGQQIWNLKFGTADTIVPDVGSARLGEPARLGEKESSDGIVVRQALGTPPATSPAAWMYSPDLLPFTSALGDAALLTARYDTGFAQAPVPTRGNYLYVRGKNTGTTSQTARVYLYSVQHDPLAGMFSDLLNPKSWDSSVFTVDGKAGNVVTLTAVNAGDVVLGSSPLVWTPPAQASETSEYVLLAWIDPGGQPPPDFTRMKPFPTLDSLRQYVEGHGNLVVLDTAYSGMFARQNGSQGPRISGADTGWTSSPDLLLYSGQEAPDTSLLEDALTWSVHQPPAPGGQNSLYIRGFNASAGSLNARVAFFYVVNDPTATKNPLLDPSTWKSDAMTYRGTTQNYVTITSNATGDFMLNDTPLVWQPAAPPPGTTYAVIAWIDDTNGSNPPPFASLPAFASLDALADYVRGVRNLVLWDGSHDGLFVRQFPGQTAAQAGTGALTSPDIILTGAAAAQDASAFTAASSYTPGTVSNAATTGVPNFVYIRAINPNNRAQRARVYLYLGDRATPSFGALSNSGFTVGGKTQNWVDLEADTQNEVLISTVPIVWVPPPPATEQSQQFLLTYVDGSANPQPPDFSAVGYTQFDAVATFVATQPQLSWVSITNTPPNPKPTFVYQYPHTPMTVTIAGRYLVGLQFVNIPVDGSVTVSIPGPDAANTIVVPSFHPSTPNAGVVWTATYPAGFPLSAAVSYWQGGTPAPAGATVQFLLVPYPA